MEESTEKDAAASMPPSSETESVAAPVAQQIEEAVVVPVEQPAKEAVAAPVDQSTEKDAAASMPPSSENESVAAPVAQQIEEAVVVPVEQPAKEAVAAPVDQSTKEAAAASTPPSIEAESVAVPVEQLTEEVATTPAEQSIKEADPKPVEQPAEEAVTAPVEQPTDEAPAVSTPPSSDTEPVATPMEQPTEEVVAASNSVEPSEGEVLAASNSVEPSTEEVVAASTLPSSEAEPVEPSMEQPAEETIVASTPPSSEPAEPAATPTEQSTEEVVAASKSPSSEAESVAALLTQVQSIVQSNTFKAFQAIMTAHDQDVEEERKVTTQARDETEAVKAELEKSKEELSALKVEFDNSHKELENLANKVRDRESETENARNEITSKDEALAVAAAEIVQLKAQMEEADTARSAAVAELDKAQKDLAASQQEIALRTSRYTGLEDFMFPLVDASREEITQHLHNLFLDAYSLVYTFFSEDFDGPTLANKTTWSLFLKHKVASQLPLPRSNSAVAKRMRVAAVMGVLADALTTRLFQPTYLLEDSNEVAELLDALLLEDDDDDDDNQGGGAAQERHLRASLLRFDTAQQDANAQARESRVVHDVYGLAGRLLPLTRQAEFAHRLAIVCRRARDAWKWVQRLGPRVEATLDPEDADTWLLLPAAAPNPAGAGERPPSPPADATRAAPDAIRLVVWPGFLIQGPDDAELVGEGFIVDKHQAQAAADEEQAQRGHRKGSRSGVRTGGAATNGNGALLHKRVSSSEPDDLSDDG